MTNLNTEFIGKVLLHREEVTSTNAVALNILSKSKPNEGTVISADFQREGKGQLGTVWQGTRGKNVYLSVILYPTFLTVDRQFNLSQAVALGVREALATFTKATVQIKWPNDLLIEGRKAGGILIQNSLQGKRIQSTVVGIGLNINQQEFPEEIGHPTSLCLHTQADLSLAEVRTRLFSTLETWYQRLRLGQTDLVQKTYLTHLYRLETWASYQDTTSGESFTGRITGVSPTGKLEIEDQQGRQRLFGLKEVRFLDQQ